MSIATSRARPHERRVEVGEDKTRCAALMILKRCVCPSLQEKLNYANVSVEGSSVKRGEVTVFVDSIREDPGCK